MWKRLLRWVLRTVDEAKRRWWIWFLLVVWELLKHRILTWANEYIDSHTGSIIRVVAYAVNRSEFAIVTLFLLVILTLIVHAYFETRPSLPAPIPFPLRGADVPINNLVAPDDTLEIIEARPDPRPPGPDIKWKRKLRVILKNRTGRQIEATSPDWLSSRAEVPFQPPFWSILQAEDRAAGGWKMGKWDKEKSNLTLKPDEIFLASVGLHDFFTVEEINNRRQTRRVGTLVIPLKIDGCEQEWRASL